MLQIYSAYNKEIDIAKCRANTSGTILYNQNIYVQARIAVVIREILIDFVNFLIKRNKIESANAEGIDESNPIRHATVLIGIFDIRNPRKEYRG